ncbi:MAG: AAA family ATPase [Burkholderiales bacterium]|jgi:MSHA biogenesis protein MshM|nr:AAA family ATPase [Burkholderiales bacterium]
MYEAHFGLREPPFGITPDTSFAYACNSHQEALNTLLVAARNGEGFMKVTGEVGTGKTLLCRRFLRALDPGRFVSAYIPNPYLDPQTLMFALAEELGVKLDRQADHHHLLRELNHALLDFARAGKTVVACMDEAQAMPQETLEALRLLTNLETEKRKLLQVVLFGQPELDDRLAQESIRQLRQRITFQYRLSVLGASEVEQYLAHRLRVAGYRGSRLFLPAAVRQLHRASRGVPRLVNIIAHKSLLLAFGEGVQQVQAQHVRSAAADTPAAAPAPRRWWLAAAAGILLAAGATLAYLQ